MARRADPIATTLIVIITLLAICGAILYSNSSPFLVPFLLSLFSGFSTLLGGVLGVWFCPRSGVFLGFLAGLAGGVMLFVSVVDFLLPPLVDPDGRPLLCAVAYAGGAVAMSAAIKRMPQDFMSSLAQQQQQQGDIEDSQSQHDDDDCRSHEPSRAALSKFSSMSVLVLAAHNFPEGCSVAISTMGDITMGGRLAAAIAIHNIIEGLIVSAPIYSLTKSRLLSLQLTLLTGLTEPLGALASLAASDTVWQLTPARIVVILAFVGGLMAAISVLELIPEGRKFHSLANTCKGVAVGAALMAAAKIGIQHE